MATIIHHLKWNLTFTFSERQEKILVCLYIHSEWNTKDNVQNKSWHIIDDQLPFFCVGIWLSIRRLHFPPYSSTSSGNVLDFLPVEFKKNFCREFYIYVLKTKSLPKKISFPQYRVGYNETTIIRSNVSYWITEKWSCLECILQNFIWKRNNNNKAFFKIHF